MLPDFGGAALGGAVNILSDTVIEITKKNVMFKPALESLTLTLDILKPLMDEVKQLNQELTQRRRESTFYESQIEEGEKHVRKCSKVCRCNIFKKAYYTNKLLELDRNLKSLIVAGLSARDSKETLILVRKIFDLLIASSGSTASDSNETLILVREIFAKIQGEQGINIVETADQVISMLSSHTPPLPKPEAEPEREPVPLIEQEIEPVLPPPLTQPPPAPPTEPSPSSPPLTKPPTKPSPPSPSPPPPVTKPPPPTKPSPPSPPPPLTKPPTKPSSPPPPPSLTKPPPPPPFTQNYDTESHKYKFQAELAGGTTSGQEFRSSYDVFKKFEVKRTVTMKPVIDKVKATLEVLEPLISQTEKFRTELDLPNGEKITDLKLEMEKAAKLIQKCSNVSGFNLLKNKHYKNMLLRLDKTLVRFFQILQIQLARDVKKSLVLVRAVHANVVEHGGISDVGLNQILSMVSSINVSSSPPLRIYEGRPS